MSPTYCSHHLSPRKYAIRAMHLLAYKSSNQQETFNKKGQKSS